MHGTAHVDGPARFAHLGGQDEGRHRVDGEQVWAVEDARVVNDRVEPAELIGVHSQCDGLVELREIPVHRAMDRVEQGTVSNAGRIARMHDDVVAVSRQRLRGS